MDHETGKEVVLWTREMFYVSHVCVCGSQTFPGPTGQHLCYWPKDSMTAASKVKEMKDMRQSESWARNKDRMVS